MRVVIGARRWLAPPLAIALIASLSLALFVSRSEEDARMGIELDFASASPNGGRASPPDSEPGGSRPLRITLVGNSIATRVGVGLRSWGQETGRARGSVWSIPGCGLLPRGERPTRDEPDPLQVAQCEKLNERLLAWPEHALPDILVLLFGSDELVARRIEGWRGFKRPGDAVYDDWLLERYGRIVDAFTARGTRVVWLTAPCARPKRQVALLERLGMFDAPSIRHHNEELLPRLQRARASSVAIVDLFGHVCPGGEFESRFGDLEDARPDGVHFSDEGGRLLAEWLGPAVIAAAAELEVAE